MFGKHKTPEPAYDRAEKFPVIRCSICTGEQVAGFKDKNTGKFSEVVCLKTDADYQEFLQKYGIDPAEVKREW